MTDARKPAKAIKTDIETLPQVGNAMQCSAVHPLKQGLKDTLPTVGFVSLGCPEEVKVN
jgi:hypothetical protein